MNRILLKGKVAGRDAKALGISLLISLTGAFILISLDKLNKLTGFLKPLNTKESNYFNGDDVISLAGEFLTTNSHQCAPIVFCDVRYGSVVVATAWRQGLILKLDE